MDNVLGYFGDTYGNPIAYMDKDGLIVFSNKKRLMKKTQIGGYSDISRILSNIEYYKLFPKRNQKQSGSGGLFGESNGICGWGNDPSCCFFGCAPLWRTSLWPVSDTTM